MRFLSGFAVIGMLAGHAWGQPPNAAVLTGKVAAVEAKGRLALLKIKDDAGTEHSFEITPKLAFEIQSQGDDDCLAPGLFVQIDTIQSNKAYFGTEFLVYPDRAGKVPPAKAVKAPPMQGQSTQRYFVSGEIVRFEKVEEGKYNLLHLRQTPKTELTVYVEPNHQIKVVQTDPKKAVADQAVTIEGRAAGTKLIPAKITIDTGETLKGEEFFADRNTKK
jgi:hypothetical protein